MQIAVKMSRSRNIAIKPMTFECVTGISVQVSSVRWYFFLSTRFLVYNALPLVDPPCPSLIGINPSCRHMPDLERAMLIVSPLRLLLVKSQVMVVRGFRSMTKVNTMRLPHGDLSRVCKTFSREIVTIHFENNLNLFIESTSFDLLGSDETP